MKQISIIGPGRMGTAMAKALKEKFSIQLCDIGDEPTADCIIFAVKPQDFKSCVEGLNTDFSERLIISIMAGISIEKIQEITGSSRVVRSMPNLPLQVGAGYTLWLAQNNLAQEDSALSKEIFKTMGGEFQTESEGQLTKLTLISGCGPAYFFQLTEMLEERAMQLGLNKEQAQEIALHTALGSSTLLNAHQEMSASEWREAVCSKGGVTIAALEGMWAQGYKEAFFTGLDTGEKRSLELNE